MATKASDLIDNISAQLHGWGSAQDRVTPLSASIGPTDTTFKVDATFGQSVGIAPGVVEIDGELLYVQTLDAATGTCTLANGFGRGYGGSVAASHSAGAKVVSRPRFPRVNLLREMNHILGAVYPHLFVPKTYTGTVTYPLDTYTIGAGALSILDVQWQDPIGNWQRSRAYNLDPFDQTLRLSDGLVGRPLRVVYATEPVQFAAETDLFSATGLPDSCSDVIELGTVAKMVPGLDISRAQLSSVEQSDRSRVVPPSAGVTVARYVMAEYQERLANEGASLRKRYKPMIRRVR